MKKIVSAVILLVAAYMVVCDTMVETFHLAKVWQYMFNMFAIIGIIPCCVFQFFPYKEEV